MKPTKDGIHFQRVTREFKRKKEKFHLEYKPISTTNTPSLNSLEYWLFERYCFFVIKRKKVYRGDIHHDRWKVKHADVKINHFPNNSVLSSIQKGSSLYHYARKKQVLYG